MTAHCAANSSSTTYVTSAWRCAASVRCSTSTPILPPSVKELERRLRARNQDSEEVVQQRMAKAVDEINHYNEYDYVIVNNDLDESVRQLRSIVAAERVRRTRQVGLFEFVREISRRD